VVVYQFNVKDVVPFKAENDAPIGPHRDRLQSFQVAFERVQPIAGKVHSLWYISLIKAGKNIFNYIQQVGSYPPSFAALIEPFQTPVLESFDH
jgi:hypothetical protein